MNFKKKYMLIFFIFILSFSFSFANESEGEDLLTTQDVSKNINIEEIRSFFENIEEGFELPGYVPYKNEKFNIYTNEGLDVGTLILENKKFKGFDRVISEDFTYKIYLKDMETINSIINSENPLDKFNELKKSKELKIEAKGVFGKVKTGIISFFAKIAGFFI